MIYPKQALVVDLPMFRTDVCVLKNERQMRQIIKQNNLPGDLFPEDSDACYVTVNRGTDTYYLIASKNWTYSNLMHECIHISHYIMDDRGIPISLANTEVEAYLATHIFEQALTCVRGKAA